MSGILLPGQENKPQESGKIEVASGYSTPDRKPPASPKDEAPAPTPQQPGRDAPAAQAQAARQTDFLFPPQGAQVKCPSCGSPYVAPVFSIVDLGANPTLRSPLLSGQVNIGVCRTCGAGGPLSAPLMVHDPENEFLGVYVPAGGPTGGLKRQQVIGELTRKLMAKIPVESQRGYMFQPREYVDLEHMMEKLWEFEGVTPEMLRRQRDQSALLQKLVGLAKDDKAIDIVLERSKGLVDHEFFAMLEQIMVLARSQPQNGEFESLRLLREKLLDRTEAGKEVKQRSERIQAMIGKVKEGSTRQELLDIVVEAWHGEDAENLVGTFALVTGVAADYEFLMSLAQRIDQAQDEEERKDLEELRQFLVGVQDQIAEQQRYAQAKAAQDAQQILSEVLQANDTEAALRARADELDETFLALVAETVRQMEEAGSAGAAQRLARVYSQALGILQERMPEDMQLLNRLIAAPDDASVRQLLRENRGLVTPEFISALKTFESRMRSEDHVQLADRVKSIRSQAALML